MRPEGSKEVNMKAASASVIATMFCASAVLAQVPLPPHSTIYNGYTRGYTFTAQTNFFINQLGLPMDAYQAGDTAGFLIRVNGAVALHSIGNVGPNVPALIQVNTGDVVDVLGNWSPAVPGSFTAHNSYSASATNFATTIEGVAHTIQRSGWQWDIGDPLYGGTYLAPTSGPIGRVFIWTNPPSGLYAHFTATPVTGPSPLAVQFTDQSFSSDPGGVLTWAWDFDNDGTIDSTLQNPTHTYNTCGDYTVVLTVTDAAHPPSTETKTNYIRTDLVTASFTKTSLGGGSYQFTDTSTPTPTAWAWDLDGDGIVDSTLQNPTFTYPATCQVYNVTLTVTLACRTSTATDSVFVAPLSATAVPFTGGNGTSSTTTLGNMFDIQVTAAEGIHVCAIRQAVYTYTGQFRADVYVAPDTYIGKESTSGAWRLVATGIGVSAGGPFTNPNGYDVSLGSGFYLPAGNYGVVVFLTAVAPAGTMYIAYTNGPQGPFVNPDITFFPNPATAPGRVSTTLFTGSGIINRCWNGTFYYGKCSVSSTPGYGFFGAGCAGALGIPRNVAVSQPIVGSTMTIGLNNLATNAAMMMIGFSNTTSPLGPLPLDATPFGAPGCFLRVNPESTLFVFGVNNGALFNLTIPNSAIYLCQQFYTQYISFDPAANPAGVAGSDACGAIIGQ
jgi:PKD repeat protein